MYEGVIDATVERQVIPVAVPVSPCTSEESSMSSSSSSFAAAPVTGRFDDIGRSYHVDTRVLGKGHQGSVRQCMHRSTGRRCAVKAIRKGARGVRPAWIAREISLLREASGHEGVAGLVDVFEDATHVHLVTELCTGGELYRKIVQRTSTRRNDGVACFEEREAAEILRQVLAAVSHLHERGIVHRDIKPENILFRTEEEDSGIRLVDFGLARRYNDGIDPPMTAIVGTPYYIAPEVLRKGYGRSCDLWSVGVVAYILLCGYPPFNGKDAKATHEATLGGRYRFPHEEWGGIGAGARDFVRRLLEADPARRMSAAEALAHPWIAGQMDASGSDAGDEGQDYVHLMATMPEGQLDGGPAPIQGDRRGRPIVGDDDASDGCVVSFGGLGTPSAGSAGRGGIVKRKMRKLLKI